MNTNRPMGLAKGFTILELVVVIIIVGALAALALPRFFGVIEFSRSTEALANLSAIRQSMLRCYFVCTSYCNCNWEILTLEDPGTLPNAHFNYQIVPLGVARYELRAIRNTLDGGNAGDRIILRQELDDVTISGTGAFAGLKQ